MVTATWRGATLARSDETIVVEGNHYFPPDSVNAEFLLDSAHHTTCPWKGEASYKTVQVAGESNPDAAWYYPAPSEAAAQITGRFAFWRGVEVSED